MQSLTPDERRVAVALADDAGWYDRAVFTLNSGEDLRFYELRFPQPHARHLRAQAKKNGLDPAWVAALIRAESAWIADARSHANARGLMQLLPSTAQMEARRLGIAWGGDASLFQPLGNITLGTAHLAQMLSKHGGKPYLATAAYNAGATPIARWLQQRPPVDVDLWIETIPYRETRDYVARILAFSVIYDWRLQGKALPVSRRMLGDDPARAPRREFSCPPTVAKAP
jgi:soluble lytic murein transglycosylase